MICLRYNVNGFHCTKLNVQNVNINGGKHYNTQETLKENALKIYKANLIAYYTKARRP